MPKRPDFTLRISIRNIEDFSPEAIVKSPRTFRPVDVMNACKNMSIEVPDKVPSIALSVAQFVFTDFFAIAHSSGLYNRQIKLWESLSKVQSIEIAQKSKGLFSSEKLSEFDIEFLDFKKRGVALAHYAAASESGSTFDYIKATREFLKCASTYQGLKGVFVCFPKPFPIPVLDFVKREIGATDSIALYESVIPKLGIPLNLLELNRTPIYRPNNQAPILEIHLVHPNLDKKGKP